VIWSVFGSRALEEVIKAVIPILAISLFLVAAEAKDVAA
jgi:hypothetical protein